MNSVRKKIRPLIKRALNKVRPREPIPPFTSEMTIEQAWHAHPKAPSVFASHHLPSCDGCSVRFEETIAEAAEAYGIDLNSFLTQLNALRL